jgi:hypothetical protein
VGTHFTDGIIVCGKELTLQRDCFLLWEGTQFTVGLHSINDGRTKNRNLRVAVLPNECRADKLGDYMY